MIMWPSVSSDYIFCRFYIHRHCIFLSSIHYNESYHHAIATHICKKIPWCIFCILSTTKNTNVLCTLYTVVCSLYSVLCTLYSVLCTLHSATFSLWAVLCPLCSVQTFIINHHNHHIPLSIICLTYIPSGLDWILFSCFVSSSCFDTFPF